MVISSDTEVAGFSLGRSVDKIRFQRACVCDDYWDLAHFIVRNFPRGVCCSTSDCEFSADLC